MDLHQQAIAAIETMPLNPPPSDPRLDSESDRLCELGNQLTRTIEAMPECSAPLVVTPTPRISEGVDGDGVRRMHMTLVLDVRGFSEDWGKDELADTLTRLASWIRSGR